MVTPQSNRKCTVQTFLEPDPNPHNPDLTKGSVPTVCPESSDPPGKMLNIFASENEVYNIF